MPSEQTDTVDRAVGTSRPNFVKADPAGAEEVAPGIRRQLLGFGDALMGARVWFSQGAVGSVHTHPHTQMSYVESGEFKVRVGDEETILTAGDSFFVPSQAPHGAVCLKPGVLIDVFAPAREDFLPETGGL